MDTPVACARIEDGVVTQVIACVNPQFAAERLGGEWVFAGNRPVGIGWLVVDGEFVPPQPPEPEPLP